MENSSKFVGSVLILVGTVMGAGMLALPIVCAGMGVVVASFAIVFVGMLMLFTGLLTLEVTLAFKPYRNHFGSMAEGTLGRFGKIISWLVMLFLLYALTAAYISGNSSLLVVNLEKLASLHLSDYWSKCIVTIALGSLVCWSIKVVDLSIRTFLSLKGLLLILTFSLMLPQINLAQFNQSGSILYLFAAIPILVTSFGFHPTIPSIVNYLGGNSKQLVWVVVLGALLPMLIYVIWVVTVLCIIPVQGKFGFINFANHSDSLTSMLTSISTITQSKWINIFINGFSDIAMTTSFLGVTLGLFDFIADCFGKSNNLSGRMQTGVITFLPPLIFTIIYPKGFVYALSYAAFFAAILVIIMPALMVYKLRKSKKLKSPIQIFGGNWMLLFVVVMGITVIILETLFSLHLLPILGNHNF